MNKKLLLLLTTVLVLGTAVATGFNALVAQKTRVEARWNEVDNQLRRRGELIGNLVETVKGATRQENAVFGDIAKARIAMSGAQSPEAGVRAAQAMDGAVKQLMVLVESYPQLRSIEAFTSLMDELAGTENRIAVARGRYNEDVRLLNTSIRSFPSNLVAYAFGFREATSYPALEGARTPPKIEFAKQDSVVRR